MSLEIFYEKVATGLLACAGMEIQVQDQTSSPAGRLVGTDHSIYRIPVTHAKLEGKSQRSCSVSAEKQVPDQENCEEMHYNVLPKMRCRTLHTAAFEGGHAKLNHRE
jgi:hypothetical protein